MLSKTDLISELGKGINIYPFNINNIKDNSINFTASKYAWTLSSGKIKFNDKDIQFQKGHSAIFKDKDNEKIIILPFSTTLIETEEVLSLDGRIGGTYHSKVGLVSKGLGHIGTMVGPNFSGHSLVAIHNISGTYNIINVGDTFLSVIFYYLKTPVYDRNATIGAHLDKMSELGISLSQTDREFLGEDWKSQIQEVKYKLISSNNYKLLKNKQTHIRFGKILKILSVRNLIFVVIFLIIMALIYLGCKKLEDLYPNIKFVEFFFISGFSGFLVAFVKFLYSFFKE